MGRTIQVLGLRLYRWIFRRELPARWQRSSKRSELDLP